MTNFLKSNFSRNFGLLLTTFLLFFAIQHFLNPHFELYLVLIALFFALILIIISLLAPHFLNPLSNAWHLLGELLGKLVSPIVLGIIFFLLITPIAIIGRLLGRDELALKRKSTNSYWVDRQPKSITSDSFKNQF